MFPTWLLSSGAQAMQRHQQQAAENAVPTPKKAERRVVICEVFLMYVRSRWICEANKSRERNNAWSPQFRSPFYTRSEDELPPPPYTKPPLRRQWTLGESFEESALSRRLNDQTIPETFRQEGLSDCESRDGLSDCENNSFS